MTAKGCARNDLPAAGRLEACWKKASNTKKQYKRCDSAGSISAGSKSRPEAWLIVAGFFSFFALGGGLRHNFFDFGGVAGQAFAQ